MPHRITPEERTAALRALLETVSTIRTLLETSTRPAAPEPTPQEQEILDLFEPGAVLTGMQVADMLGDAPDNGTLRRRLAEMVRRGLLVNRRPGYALPDA